MSTTQTSEFEAMREFADNLWRQDFQYRIRDMLNHAINGYKAEVVSNPGGGKLEVRFPFEDSTHTFQCSAIVQGASAGSQVLVECLGGLSNAFIRSYARVDRGGGGGGGDMLAADYDPSDAVRNAGGIVDYVEEQIPAAVTEATVSGWGFTKNTGTYSKPSGGIPKSDLADAVQTSLGRADSALQSHQDISGKLDKTGGTMTGNLDVGSSHIGTNGYLQGTWLQTTSASALTDSDQIAVLQNGWIYYVAKATMKSMLGVPTIQYSDTDIGEGAQLATGTFYFVYE